MKPDDQEVYDMLERVMAFCLLIENEHDRVESDAQEENAAYREAVARLPITRGEFVAVPIETDGIPNGTKRYDSAEYHSRVRNALREQYGKRVVSCTGKCGDCGNGKHWCGDKQKLDNVVIGIGIH